MINSWFYLTFILSSKLPCAICGQCYKNFLRPKVTPFHNKLECLSLASLSRPGAYPRLEHLKGASLG